MMNPVMLSHGQIINLNQEKIANVPGIGLPLLFSSKNQSHLSVIHQYNRNNLPLKISWIPLRSNPKAQLKNENE